MTIVGTVGTVVGTIGTIVGTIGTIVGKTVGKTVGSLFNSDQKMAATIPAPPNMAIAANTFINAMIC